MPDLLELNSCLSSCYPESLGSIPLGVRDVSPVALAGKLQGRAMHTEKVTAVQQRLVGLLEWVSQDLPGCWETCWTFLRHCHVAM